MVKFLLELLSAIGFFIWARYADSNLQPELYGMCIGFATATLIEVLAFLYTERKYLKLYLDSMNLFARSEIRLTIAYLYRIECNGKYLLVKSKRIGNTYQPVGGVYKYFHPEAHGDLAKMSIVPDHAITNDNVSEFDLRLKMLKRKKLRKFLKWFFSRTERELDPWREFYEELVVPGILPAAHFGYIHYELFGQHFEPIHHDKFFNIPTFKYVDVFTPKFVNAAQVNEIKQLRQTEHPDYIWVTQDEINKGKSDQGHLIAEHTHKIFYTQKLN